MRLLKSLGKALVTMGFLAGFLTLLSILVAVGIWLLDRSPVFTIALFAVLLFAGLTWIHYEDTP